MADKEQIVYRRATMRDLPRICEFVDWWLAGRAKARGVKNAGDDYFVTPSQHRAYLKGCHVLLAEAGDRIVGWAVKEPTNVLIHLLVAADWRGRGIGKKMLHILDPDIIRSKSDQTTGDPARFYEAQGYMRMGHVKVGRKRNIDLMAKRMS